MKVRRLIRRLLLAAVLVFLLPFLSSRVLSLPRMITVHSADDSPTLSTKQPLRIVSYNIAHGRGLAESNWTGESRAARQQRLEEIAALLRDLDADIIVLNEVDFDCSWSHPINQAAELAKLAGYDHRAEQRNLDFRLLGWTWRFGNAVLSRHPIKSASVIDLPALKPWEAWLAGKKRGIACEIINGEQSVCVMGVHLSHRSEDLRVKSARRLTRHAKTIDMPVIIAGDLNSTPPGWPCCRQTGAGDNAIATLDAAQAFQRCLNMTPTRDQLTFHSSDPRSVIDWILLPAAWPLLEYRAVDARLSDHRPILVEATCAAIHP